MQAKNKKDISEIKKPKYYNHDDDRIVFDFSGNDVFKSVRVKDFTNYLKDPEMFFIYFKEMMKNVAHLSCYTSSTILKNDHCHVVNGDKVKIVKEVLVEKSGVKKDKTQVKNRIDDFLNDTEIFQFGAAQGVRIVGYISGNIIKVLFIDFHHLIYENKKYHSGLLSKYDLCPNYNIN